MGGPVRGFFYATLFPLFCGYLWRFTKVQKVLLPQPPAMKPLPPINGKRFYALFDRVWLDNERVWLMEVRCLEE